ncbi:MAG: 2-hydroxyacid dehydrogenase [Candidatus Rokuibacteriota bacterium]
MADPVILMPPSRNLEPDVLAVGRRMLPPGFELRLVSADQLAEGLRDADYLMGFIGPLDDATLAAARRLRLVQLLSVGYDRFNLAGARAARVPVAVNGGANAIAVAEHAILLMMATLRHLTDLDAGVRAGRWGAGSHRLYELWSSTIGIVGMGRIGQEVAQRLAGWGSTLVYHDPVRLTPERERELGVTFAPLPELLERADVVTVHVPLSAATRHLIDGRALARLRPTAVLINTSRGELVDEAALAEALRSGRIGGAGLDVLSKEPPPSDHPLLSTPNTVLTPHVAGPTWQSWPRRFGNAYANISRVARGERPQWVVPELADLVR